MKATATSWLKKHPLFFSIGLQYSEEKDKTHLKAVIKTQKYGVFKMFFPFPRALFQVPSGFFRFFFGL